MLQLTRRERTILEAWLADAYAEVDGTDLQETLDDVQTYTDDQLVEAAEDQMPDCLVDLANITGDLIVKVAA